MDFLFVLEQHGDTLWMLAHYKLWYVILILVSLMLFKSLILLKYRQVNVSQHHHDMNKLCTASVIKTQPFYMHLSLSS